MTLPIIRLYVAHLHLVATWSLSQFNLIQTYMAC